MPSRSKRCGHRGFRHMITFGIRLGFERRRRATPVLRATFPPSRILSMDWL